MDSPKIRLFDDFRNAMDHFPNPKVHFPHFSFSNHFLTTSLAV